ncbi:MAG: hypothetical protein K2Y22_15910 [Candidatus Obscuribacterales bacterium]|nr:hypothetical protein [Candidatus Obscuribacterales bacterium]
MKAATINQECWSAAEVGSFSHDLKRALNIQLREFIYWLYDVDSDKPEKLDATVIKSLCFIRTSL